MPRLHCSVAQEGGSWTDGQRAAGAHVAGAKSASEATRVLGATLGLSVDDGGELAGLSYGEAPDGAEGHSMTAERDEDEMRRRKSTDTLEEVIGAPGESLGAAAIDGGEKGFLACDGRPRLVAKSQVGGTPVMYEGATREDYIRCMDWLETEAKVPTRACERVDVEASDSDGKSLVVCDGDAESGPELVAQSQAGGATAAQQGATRED